MDEAPGELPLGMCCALWSDAPVERGRQIGTNETKPLLRFRHEWRGGWLWPGNDTARRVLDLGPYDLHDPCPLPLSSESLRSCSELGRWHDTSLNWDYPPDPGPWRQDECDRFNLAARQLFAQLAAEVGPTYEIHNAQPDLTEDPDLDRYLEDPPGFAR